MICFKLFDINNLILEDGGEIDLNDYIKEYKNHSHLLKNKGLSPVGVNYKVDNENKFIKYFITFLFPEYSITDAQKEAFIDKGHPDFILKKNKEKIYLELKINQDALRLSQMEWITQNKEKKIKVLWINFDVCETNKTYL